MTQYLPAARTAAEFPGAPFEEWKLPAPFPK
jgi:hypothetical protein